MIFFVVTIDFFKNLTDPGLISISKDLKFELCEGDMPF